MYEFGELAEERAGFIGHWTKNFSKKRGLQEKAKQKYSSEFRI